MAGAAKLKATVARLNAAQTYLEAKRAAGNASEGAADAAVAIRAGRAAAGPAGRMQVGGQKFLEEKRKERAAAEYLAEEKRRQREGGGS
jgi:hypothetical protein